MYDIDKLVSGQPFTKSEFIDALNKERIRLHTESYSHSVNTMVNNLRAKGVKISIELLQKFYLLSPVSFDKTRPSFLWL